MKYSLNLATGTYINHRRLYMIAAVLCLFLVGLLLVNSISLINAGNRTRQLESRLNELRGQKGKSSQEGAISRADQADLAQRIEVANELLVKDSYRWTDLLNQLEAHLADGISIRGLQPDYKTGVLKLSGVAASITDLRHFLDNLNRSDVFTQIYLKDQRTEKTKDDLDGGISFSIELMRRGGNES